MAVCMPLHAKRLCSPARTRCFLAAVVVVSVLYNACRFFEYTIVPFRLPGNITVPLPFFLPLTIRFSQ